MLRRRDLLRGGAAVFAGAAGCSAFDAPAGTTAERTTTTESTTLATTAGGAATTARPDGLSVTWTSGPDMPLRRTQTTAVALDGRVYVVGGIVESGDRHTAVYDPAAERWETAPPPPEPVNHTAAATHGGRIHVLGGYTGSFLGGDPLDAHWIYDPAADEWTDGPPLPTARGAMVAVAAGGQIHAIGGADDTGTTPVVEVYDPAGREWTRGASLPTAREHLAGGAVGGRAYAAGGRQGLSPMVDATACLGSEGWQPRAPMPTARAGIAGAALGGHLFVFGGEEVGEQVFGAVEAYHPPTDAWTAVAPLPTPRWGLGVAALDGRVYTVGGGAVPSARETRTLEVMTLDGAGQ